MRVVRTVAAFWALLGGVLTYAQQTSQVELKIESSNRTLTVSGEARVTAEPEIAILHIGFITQPSDAKAAYAEGARLSSQVIAAVKQAGIEESAIRSDSQSLESWEGKNHKFRLQQNWVVKVAPARAAEVLDIAISAGANSSGEIEWTLNDEKALEDQALEKATARAQSDASVLAKGMGVKLGSLVYVTNHVGGISAIGLNGRNFSQPAGASEAFDRSSSPPPPLAIEPHKVSRTASVYAVFAIE